MLAPYTLTGSMERGIVVRTAAIRWPLWRLYSANLAVDRNVAQTQTRPLEEFLSDYVYAQPRFILLVLACLPVWGWCWWPVGVQA